MADELSRFLDDALDRGRQFRPDVHELVLLVLHEGEKGRPAGTAVGRWPSTIRRDALERAVVALMSPGRVYELRAYFGEEQDQREKVVLRPLESDLAPAVLN